MFSDEGFRFEGLFSERSAPALKKPSVPRMGQTEASREGRLRVFGDILKYVREATPQSYRLVAKPVWKPDVGARCINPKPRKQIQLNSQYHDRDSCRGQSQFFRLSFPWLVIPLPALDLSQMRAAQKGNGLSHDLRVVHAASTFRLGISGLRAPDVAKAESKRAAGTPSAPFTGTWRRLPNAERAEPWPWSEGS